MVYNLPKPSLVFITPNGFCQDYSKAIRVTKDAIAGGVSLVQLRDRDATTIEILQLTETFLSEGIHPSKLSINGLHPNEIITLSSIVGLHVREADITEHLPAAKKILPADAITGCSVHSVDSARLAMALFELTYLQVGTMFSTRSHPGKVPEGPPLLRNIRQELGPKQMLIGIGGISKSNLDSVFDNGATGIAVISSIAESRDTQTTASSLLRASLDSYVKTSSSR